jgi:hypothetical protein
VAISAVFTDDPQGYIGDVLAQLCMPYLEYCEDVRRYVKLFEVVENTLQAASVNTRSRAVSG